MAAGLSSPIHRQSSMPLVASMTEPPPTATSRSALASRAALAPATTSSRGLCERIVAWVPTWRAPSAFSRRCRGPFSFCARERVEVTNTRCAPIRSASATTASPAGSPNTMRSCAVMLKVPGRSPGVVLLMGRSDGIVLSRKPLVSDEGFAVLARAPLRHRRRAPRQDLGKHLAVDVAAAQHETDALSAHAHALLEERGQRRGPGALGDIVGIFPDGAHGLRDLVFAHAHDACRAPPEDGKRRLVWHAAGHAVGERGGRIGGNRAALGE